MEDFRGLMIICDDCDRCYESIKIGDFALSVQASALHYCSPRKNLDDLHSYTSFELAIFEKSRHGDKWVMLEQDERFLMLEPYANDGGQTSIATYVPVGVVQKVYEHLVSMASEGGSVK